MPNLTSVRESGGLYQQNHHETKSYPISGNLGSGSGARDWGDNFLTTINVLVLVYNSISRKHDMPIYTTCAERSRKQLVTPEKKKATPPD